MSMKTPIFDKIIQVLRSVIHPPRIKRRGRPCLYKAKMIAVMFAVMMLKSIIHFKSMHKFLITNPDMAKLLGFKGSIPDRSTLSRRFKGIYEFVKRQIKSLGHFLLAKNITQSHIISVDSTMHKACGPLWHKKDKMMGHIPGKLRNIDKEAEWGFSQYKQWVYGYKTHLISTSPERGLTIPLDCEVSTANQPDSCHAQSLVGRFSLKGSRYLLGDKGYDDQKLRALCESKNIKFIGPMGRKPTHNKIRLAYLRLYQSKTGQKIYKQRAKTIEPLFGHIKELFLTAQLRMKGLKNVRTYLSFTVWLYQVLVYVNFIFNRPLRRLKYLVCAV